MKSLQSRMLHINSWAAGSGNPTNFAQAISRPISGVTAVRFVSFSCPNLLPPFNAFDNVIKIQTDGNTTVTRSVTIDTNMFFADIASFVTYLNGLLQASPDTRLRQIAFSFNASLLRLVMTDAFGSCRPVPYAANVTEGNYRIGFANTYYPFQASHTADGYPACILRTDVIKVHVNLIGNSSSAIAADADCTYTVPVNVNVGQLISYGAPHHIDIPCNISNLSEVSVRLTDADNVECRPTSTQQRVREHSAQFGLPRVNLRSDQLHKTFQVPHCIQYSLRLAAPASEYTGCSARQ